VKKMKMRILKALKKKKVEMKKMMERN